jgi:hypothetical protein
MNTRESIKFEQHMLLILDQLRIELRSLDKIVDKENLVFDVLDILNPEQCIFIKAQYDIELHSDEAKLDYFKMIEDGGLRVCITLTSVMKKRVNELVDKYPWANQPKERGIDVVKLFNETSSNLPKFTDNGDTIATRDYIFRIVLDKVLINRKNTIRMLNFHKDLINQHDLVRGMINHTYYMDDLRFCKKCGLPIQYGWHDTLFGNDFCGKCVSENEKDGSTRWAESEWYNLTFTAPPLEDLSMTIDFDTIRWDTVKVTMNSSIKLTGNAPESISLTLIISINDIKVNDTDILVCTLTDDFMKKAGLHMAYRPSVVKCVTETIKPQIVDFIKTINGGKTNEKY